jgi:hypothetical protein
MAERRFRPLGGMLDRKWHHQSIPWPRFVRIVRFWNFVSISYRSKVIRVFDLHVKCPVEIRRKRHSLKIFLIDQTPRRHFLVTNDVFEAWAWRTDRRVPVEVVTRSETRSTSVAVKPCSRANSVEHRKLNNKRKWKQIFLRMCLSCSWKIQCPSFPFRQ